MYPSHEIRHQVVPLEFMSFAHPNCRSWFTGFDQISSWLPINSYDIFAVSETWLNDDVLSEAVAIDGYEFYRRNRAGRGGGYLDSVLPKCLVEFDKIILLGDFNSNFLENDNKILECLSCYGFQQVIKEPTRTLFTLICIILVTTS
nr:unnamed protein product [Callosobruchus chinensis]